MRELEITVPDFRLESSQMTSVDGHPAVELFYQFKNDNAVIFQKQTLILLGDHPAGQKMVCYIGTCTSLSALGTWSVKDASYQTKGAILMLSSERDMFKVANE